MFFVRPTAAGPIVCVSLYLLLRHPREFLRYAIGGSAWLVLYALYSWRIFGTVFPSYYAQVWAPAPLWFATGIFGSLFSPSRGLFVYSSGARDCLLSFVANWRSVAARPLARLAMFSSFSILVVVAAHLDWWGGNCYGPRYLSDAMPWLMLLAILAIAAMPPLRIPCAIP